MWLQLHTHQCNQKSSKVRRRGSLCCSISGRPREDLRGARCRSHCIGSRLLHHAPGQVKRVACFVIRLIEQGAAHHTLTNAVGTAPHRHRRALPVSPCRTVRANRSLPPSGSPPRRRARCRSTTASSRWASHATLASALRPSHTALAGDSIYPDRPRWGSGGVWGGVL